MEEAAAVALLEAPEGFAAAPEKAGDPAPLTSEESAGAPRPDPGTQGEARGPSRVEIRITLDSGDSALLKILSALQPQGPFPAPVALAMPNERLSLPAPMRADALGGPIATPACGWRRPSVSLLLFLAALLLGFTLRAQFEKKGVPTPPPPTASLGRLADEIVASESHGDAAAKNPLSSALGAGQFVEATWLGLVRKHRPDMATGLSDRQILDLRKDPELSRVMTSRYAEANSSQLARRGLPVTPGALYLAHFAGPAGAVAILTAPETADAASVIANADARPGITREKILNGNPFMKSFTAKDLKNWADLKMQGLTLAAGDDRAGPARE